MTTIVHKRRVEERRLVKEVSFEEIRTTVTKDVLTENMEDLIKRETKVNTMRKELEELREKLMVKQTEAKNMAVDIEECNGEAKSSSDALANLEGQKSSLSSEFEKDKAEWSKEIASLKEESSQKSKVCNYILKTSDEGRKLCGLPAEAPAEQNEEKPKAEMADQAAPEASKQR